MIVGVSTDEFNSGKGKKTIIPFEDRIEIVRNLKPVDLAIAETNWEQKISDIKKYNVTIFGMGYDWKGKFDHLNEWCEVIYLPRTDGVSSTNIKNSLNTLNQSNIAEIKKSLDLISSIIDRLQ